MTTSAKKAKFDGNSTENQKIKGQFVKREVLTCFSYEMEAVLRASTVGQQNDYPLPSFETIENMYEYKCPNCGDGVQDLDTIKKTNDDGDQYFHCPNCEHQTDKEWENEPQEVFEWWIVTDYLYRKLKDRGQVVLEWGNNCYWGRCTSGQAILLDGVISDICAEMEILKGQKNDWSEHK